MSISFLESLYRHNNPYGTYFDKDTLAFFGSRYRKVTTTKNGYVYSEKQTNAPEGIGPWAAMFFDLDGNPHPTSWGATRAEAIKGLENE